ncbi:MAG: alpha/beta hydrolase, partial [Myxococcales bacterium]|nr:alpha/beta hydrolase [Myxococcales bacterium]
QLPPDPQPPPGADTSADGLAPPPSAPVAVDPVPVRLRAADGVVVHGLEYALEASPPRPIVLLFHQAGSNAAEYGPIAPRLQALGYQALAIDQRSGKRRFGRDNLTVRDHGKSTGIGSAYRDLEAALAWAQAQGHDPVIAWGSSYSAALVFRLAAEHPGQLAAVLAFSPGEYLGATGTVAGWAREAGVPVFITAAPGKEVDRARGIATAAGVEPYVPSHGVHGSSTLHPSRNPAGHRQVWAAVEAFLARAVPPRGGVDARAREPAP